ncbi:unnamed protein product [Amoebophrya sp. A25]|nr:unnamed protein product [Amoebophrya sp. A25]|eukprot:GSA25T00004206001.1
MTSAAVANADPWAYLSGVYPWYEPESLPPPSRGSYHGVNGRQLKVIYPGHTDLVWSTNFNDEYAPYLVCDRNSYWWKKLPKGMKGTLNKSWGIHPEFIFSKKISKVTITILDGTKFSLFETNPKAIEHMKRRRVLWNATFSLGGGNHILPTASAPPFTKFCDAPPHHVFSGSNVGRFNQTHMEPSLVSFFDVKIDGYTTDGNDFHEDMRLMLDRRYPGQDILDFAPAATEARNQQRMYMKTGPALMLAKAKNYMANLAGQAQQLKQNTFGV